MNADRPDPPSPEDPDHRLDVDAVFAEIVARWEPSEPEPDTAEATPEVAPAEAEPEAPERPSDPDELRSLFRPAWQDRLDTEATWEDEGHFVPPPPPPLPPVDPRRKLAWAGLALGPAVALLVLVLGVRLAGWVAFLLVLGFVGGFVYLVATMRSSRDDDWPGDDGAVL
jgi:hypothetical protein